MTAATLNGEKGIISQPILFQARGLHKSFGGVRAVRDISFNIPAGVVFAIIGPNGAGKSTLLNLMSGLYECDSGSLIFEGADLSGLPAHRRVRHGIARTFQKIRLFKQLTVLDVEFDKTNQNIKMDTIHYMETLPDLSWKPLKWN